MSSTKRLSAAGRMAAQLTFVGVLSATTGLVSQPHVAQAQSISYQSVEVRGNARIASSTILSIAAVELGVVTSPAKINSAVQRLFQTGFFEAVDIDVQGSNLVINVLENPTINRVSVEGNRRLKDEVLLGLIESTSRQTFSPTRAESDTQKIAEAYAASGRVATQITPKVIKRSQNRVDLVFQVVEGSISEIESVSFVGNRNFSDRRLRSVIESKRAGIFRALSKRDTFVADRIEFDKQKLSEFYLNNGYIDFEVLAASSDLTRSQDSFGVTFNVREGQQYTYGDVTIVSNEPDVDAAEFENLQKIKNGRRYDPRKLNDLVDNIEIRANSLNYPFLVARPIISRNDDARTLDIEISLERGQRAFIERIDIEGNAITLDKVIRREFKVAEGDAFNQRAIQQAADRVRALDYFEEVNVEAREGSAAGRAVIDVNVKEKTTGSLGFGVGYNSSNGPVGNVEISQRNFLGRGQNVRFGISTSGEAKDFQLAFTEPQFLDRDLAVGFDLSGRTTSSSYLPVDFETIQFSPRVSFPTGEDGRFTIYYKLARSEVLRQETDDSTDAVPLYEDASAITLADVADGTVMTSSIGFGYKIDKRDSIISPTSGYTLSFDQEFAGLGGDVSFSKTSANFKMFRSFFNDNVVVTAELEGGYLHNIDRGSRITNRYFLGGDQLRGFEDYGIGPRDASTGDPVGGNTYAVARLEASFPIGLPEEYGIYGGVFYDVGSVWGIDDTFGVDLNGEDDSAIIRSAVGFSIFWDTAIGPLRFNFAKPLKKQAYDETETFRFTVDTRF
ncbi:outer membrane protein assembly factor BamA [Amylibacter ulvae]|uniref:Outer membrane protein assembly factor BamA n=1 Tax=Paramylibacter ulvae TaxID=1651968 RepID=A0ABQ3CTK2_9RHOB|nr:outer membrane protein assembly factor BamA [Amylibacter ulvae]GHA42331.1 outer membrane protein assembly factor BamA [Amylibacter ulvae]